MITNKENTYVEFKEDAVSNEKIARELIAFSNTKGGYLFLGVSDDREPVGLTRDNNEERIMNICDDLVSPTIYPAFYEVNIKDNTIAVIEIEPGSNKPYCIPKGQEKKFNPDEIYIRQGSKTRKLRNRDELQRLFQVSNNLHYEIIPASYATLKDINIQEVEDYLKKYKKESYNKNPDINIVLKNLDVLTNTETGIKPTIAGMLLFGKERIEQILPQSGILCVKVAGTAITDKKTDSIFFNRDAFSNIDDTFAFFKRYNTHSYDINGVKRIDHYDYPESAFREVLANAIIHRDYTIVGSKISVWIYDDRIEVKSPGSIPNTVTIDKMKYGTFYHRNPVIVKFFYDAGIVEMMGQGIPIADELMMKNGNPELTILDKEHEVVVILYKKKT